MSELESAVIDLAVRVQGFEIELQLAELHRRRVPPTPGSGAVSQSPRPLQVVWRSRQFGKSISLSHGDKNCAQLQASSADSKSRARRPVSAVGKI